MKIIRPWTFASLVLAASILAACGATPPPTPLPPTAIPAAPPAASVYDTPTPFPSSRTDEIHVPNGDLIIAQVIANPPVWTYHITAWNSRTISTSTNIVSIIISSVTVPIGDCQVTRTTPTQVRVGPFAQGSITLVIGVSAADVRIELTCNKAIVGPILHLAVGYTYLSPVGPLLVNPGNGVVGLAGPKFP